ncbi:hypothetical protein TREMEDRAFT_68887 [Tremella mesenterica DSM 1558]|uniref:uncharacterized protein n=1 Tax=Tremella mesenterica (strain ATCC 24925 / CBS 8224 / DSM 1558 / NBRC 9311 / NRRL Y-6157 / RJB 2259-6 / UBC 559-6) TaxID=578456 RepID=UPI0003F49020|nr:uncharacterized protein TREMEDRAFT_68887 [Tremella mesenterica DSM 1558]EIW68962.1 hypothetical protein TREMEDRAFT_68887 [Tremella mesenterica DSM 1558]
MTSIINATAQAAHSAFASLASASPIKPGDSVPDVEIKLGDLEGKVNFSKLSGKSVLVLVPGAFSPTCTSQVPSYIKQYEAFKAKGVKDIYIIAINDMFVIQAWAEKLKGEEKSETVKFAGDDTGAFGTASGLVFDAQAVFGGPRLKRGAVVIHDGKVVSVVVEPNPGEVTVSDANEVLKNL